MKIAEIPGSWTWAGLAELGRWLGGGTPSKENLEFWKGSIPWVSAKDMKSFELRDSEDHITEEAVANSATSKLPPESVLVVTRSGILRHTFPVAINRVEVTINQDLKAVILASGIHADFVAHALRFYGDEILHVCSKDGTTVQSIEFDQLKRFQIPLAPISEQPRIVAEIEKQFTRLDAAVTALKRVQANLKRYRAAVLKAACEGRLVPTEAELARKKGISYETGDQLLARILEERRGKWEADQLAKMQASGKIPKDDSWKERYIEAGLPRISSLAPLPEGWTWATMRQVGHVQLGRQRAPQHHTGEHMRPYLRVANVFEDRIDISDVMEMNFTPAEFRTYQLNDGDILLNEGQSLELIGRPALYRNQLPGACFQNTLVRFRGFQGVEPRYALAVFLSYLHNQRFQKIAKWTTNIAHLGAERFADLEFPLPPTAEQVRIADTVEDRVSLLRNMEVTVATDSKRADRLRQSILKRAFEGELVPQDPNDEPASALLERIRAERKRLISTVPRFSKTRSRITP